MAWSMRAMCSGARVMGSVLKSIFPASPLRAMATSECTVTRPSLMASHSWGLSRIFWWKSTSVARRSPT